ncbi:MAG: vWA domain-containing protein [Candidatus Odinarchaeota archaeon]
MSDAFLPPDDVSVAEAELLVFLLDGSGSMTQKNTFDGRSKEEHLVELVQLVLKRLQKGSKRSAFRISYIYFADLVEPEIEGSQKYFNLSEAVDKLASPVERAGGGKTALADALHGVNDIVQTFNSDEGIPAQKNVTVFLFTDGHENVRTPEDVRSEGKMLLTLDPTPIIATISVGMDADEKLLMEIASEPNDRQLRHLDLSGVLHHLPDQKKLFLQGHVEGTVSEEKAEALRNFVETLSETSKSE